MTTDGTRDREVPHVRRESPEYSIVSSPPLIGRVAEREGMISAVRRAITDNQAVAVTVLGNLGMGKNRLVTEAIADLSVRFPELRVYTGTAREDAGIQPAIARILRTRFNLSESSDTRTQAQELSSQLADLLGDRRVDEILYFLGTFLGLKFGSAVLSDAFDEDPAAYQHVSRAILRRLFEVDAQRSPLMLVFEDVHLAGPDGLRMVRELIATLGKAPVILVCTARPEILGQSQDFFSAGGDRHVRVDLGPLDPTESRALAHALLSAIESVPHELIDTAVEVSAGNPLLIEQVVMAYLDQGVIRVDPDGMATITLDRLDRLSLPMSVEDAARARLASLTPPEREVLERAALMGSVFWIGGLVVLGRTHREPPKIWGGGEDLAPHIRDLLHGLAERDFVLRMPESAIPGDEEYIFEQNLEREHLLEMVPPETAVAYHQMLAEWLEFRLSERTEEQLDLLARHYELGNRPLRAARCYLVSADRARARYANQKAVEHYRKGLQMLGEHDVGLRLDAYHHLGDVLALLGQSDDALAQFRAMLSLAWRLDLKAKGGAAHNRIGRLYRDSGSLEEAMRHLGTGLALFEAAGDEPGIASSYDDIGKIHWLRGSYDTALKFLQDGLQRREALGDTRSIALSLNNIGLVFQDSGQYKAAYDALHRALELRRAVGDLSGVVMTLNNLGTIHQDRGEDSEAVRLWLQALEGAREIGDRRRQAVLLLNIGEGHYRMRSPDEAIRILTEVEQLCVELGDRLLLAESRRGLGKAHFLGGHIATALAHLERALELFESVRSRVHVGIARRTLAEVLAAHGLDSDEGRRAEALFRDALEVFESIGAELEYARTARAFADLLAPTGDPDSANEGHAEATRLRARGDEIYARMRTGSAAAGPKDFVKIEATNPGINRREFSGQRYGDEPIMVVPEEPTTLSPDDVHEVTPPGGTHVRFVPEEDRIR